MTETALPRLHDTSQLPFYPVPRAAGYPFDPLPRLTELRAHEPFSPVRAWDGTAARLVTRYQDQRPRKRHREPAHT